MMPRLIKSWRYRIVRINRNLLMIIVGPTGSGKSYCALVIAKMIDPTFKVKERVVFNVEDFMKLLNSGKLKRGSVIVWDEAGVGLPAREWYTISNKAINYVLQTFRHMNLCVIFTTPTFEYIDKQTRVLFHVLIETVKIMYDKKQVIVKIKKNEYNPVFGKPYNPYYREMGIKKERFNIGIPTKQMINEYEDLKKQFSKQIREEVEQDVKIAKATQRHKRLTDAEVMKRIKEENIPLDAYTLQFRFNIGKDRAYRIIHNYEKFSPTI